MNALTGVRAERGQNMHETQQADWIKALFRYQYQLRETETPIGPHAIEIIKTIATLILTGSNANIERVAAATTTLLNERTTNQALTKLARLRVLTVLGASWKAHPPGSWKGYDEAAPDPADVDRRVTSFVRDLDARLAERRRRVGGLRGEPRALVVD